MKNLLKNTQNQGFTLVETAIVLTIGGILLAMLGSSVAAFIERNKVDATVQELEIIKDAINEYLVVNGQLPCAARTTAGTGDANFGRELPDCTLVVAGTTRSAGTGARMVRIGSVPTRTLNLPDDLIMDAWGNRYTYAVTEVLAEETTYDPADGAINVVDSVNNSILNPVGSGHFIVVSHGQDGIGAALLNGNIATACTTTPPIPLDAENCDGDAIFRDTILNSSSPGVNYYDDYTTFFAGDTTAREVIPTGAVMAFNLTACPVASGWQPLANAQGRVIVGAGTINDNYPGEARPPWTFNDTYAVGDQGGYGTWQMDEAELDAHDHNFNVNNYSAFSTTLPAGGPNSVLVLTGPPPGTNIIGSRGANTPQKNMPPYLAYIYCQKI